MEKMVARMFMSYRRLMTLSPSTLPYIPPTVPLALSQPGHDATCEPTELPHHKEELRLGTINLIMVSRFEFL